MHNNRLKHHRLRRQDSQQVALVFAMDVRNIGLTDAEGLEAERQLVQDLVKGFGSDFVLSKTKSDLPTLQTIA